MINERILHIIGLNRADRLVRYIGTSAGELVNGFDCTVSSTSPIEDDVKQKILGGKSCEPLKNVGRAPHARMIIRLILVPHNPTLILRPQNPNEFFLRVQANFVICPEKAHPGTI